MTACSHSGQPPAHCLPCRPARSGLLPAGKNTRLFQPVPRFSPSPSNQISAHGRGSIHHNDSPSRLSAESVWLPAASPVRKCPPWRRSSSSPASHTSAHECSTQYPRCTSAASEKYGFLPAVWIFRPYRSFLR